MVDSGAAAEHGRSGAEVSGGSREGGLRRLGVEDTKGWLVDATHSDELFGPLQVPVEVMIGWLADWISNGRQNLNKPTAFDSRDGSF